MVEMVEMKLVIWVLKIIVTFIISIAMPMTSPTGTATHPEMPCLTISQATNTDTSPASAPTLMSIRPLISASAIPTETMPT